MAQPTDLDTVHAAHAIYRHEEAKPFLGGDPMPKADFRPIVGALVARWLAPLPRAEST